MEKSDFESLCLKIFSNLFEKAKSKNETQFLTSFFPFYKQQGYNIISYIIDYEFTELLELIKTLHIPEDNNEIDNKTKSRIRLLIYCHIIEIDFVYMVIYNMLRTISCQKYSAQITITDINGKIKVLEYPYQKIELIIKESQKSNINFKEIFIEMFDGNLRNVFSHSQYFLHDTGGLEASNYLAPTSSKFMKSGKPTYNYNIMGSHPIYSLFEFKKLTIDFSFRLAYFYNINLL